MLTNREFADEQYANDALMDETKIEGWGDKAHDILDKIANELDKMRILVDDHDCRGEECDNINHEQI